MRVISGKYKNKLIKGFDIEGTRPTMDRVKESMFATIYPYLKDSIVLDLFAGSGNLGIEALSNGCKAAYFVDNNKKAVSTIKDNLTGITEDTYVYNMDYIDAITYFKKNNIKFDLILLDPPYKDKILNNILGLIIDFNILNENGIVVLEYENMEMEHQNYNIIKNKKYGNKYVMILNLKK